jgi:pimeloyl-ACP methyl ester carboxylesterase
MAQTSINTVKADGIDIFYRSAGTPGQPTLLLLHGFPSSSHQFRELLPLLGATHHVLAPDLPGFGFTTVPAERAYEYSFASLAGTLLAFVDALALTKYSIYIFDYGAPTGLRLALARPDAVQAIVTQNGNAYVDGFGAAPWTPITNYWKSGSAADRQIVRDSMLNLEVTKWQYTDGNPKADQIPPEAWHLDYALMQRPGNAEIQLDLFYDYRNNIPLYERFHEYFRSSNVPVLAVWGKNDQLFIYPGAEAFGRDVKDFEIHPIDSGHFAIETNAQEVADVVRAFLQKRGL